MKQITIISGKGGTGKTTLASSFIKLARNQIAVDCDVDAANLHILLSPVIKESKDFIGGEIAIIGQACTECGKCQELCRFEAIIDSDSGIKVDPLKCEGCGVCQEICPVDAIEMHSGKQGQYYISDTDICPMVHARLDPGAENSGLLVTMIRNIAEDIAVRDGMQLIIIDGAPGIGCPVISSLNGVDYALIVTEPTMSGISDFKKAHEVTRFFNIKTLVCINKADINRDNCNKISEYCRENEIDLLGEIPYDEKVPETLSRKEFIVDVQDSPAGIEITRLWHIMEKRLYT